MSLEKVQRLLSQMSADEHRQVLDLLRRDHKVSIHPIEEEWKTTGEAILEAIFASPDLTQRGVRGVLAEAIFRTSVVPQLESWTSVDFSGDLPYDLLLAPGDGRPPLKIQVKNQRREKGEPKIELRATKRHGSDVYVVETQRTRSGRRTDASGQETSTRPYRFGEFDILAVCLHPLTKSWEDFVFCPAHLLIPRPGNLSLLAVMQPVFVDETNGWTRDFERAARLAYQAMSTAV